MKRCYVDTCELKGFFMEDENNSEFVSFNEIHRIPDLIDRGMQVCPFVFPGHGIQMVDIHALEALPDGEEWHPTEFIGPFPVMRKI